MLPAERRRRIAAEVAARPSVKTEELADLFEVSGETIRRDLLRLQSDGLVERVHGGATPAEQPRAIEGSYTQRRAANLAGKQAMARAAAGLLRPGDTVIFDVGTSVLEVARAVPVTWTGRVLTNSLLVAVELADRSDVEVLVSGGRARAGDLAMAGTHAQRFFGDYYADLAFLGSGGVHARAGLTDFHADEVDTRRIMFDHAARAYVLADATKLGAVVACRVCGLNRITGLVTDGTPDRELADALAAAGVDLIGSRQSADSD
jgi:DeoR family fructose operon transcriptional repressor